MLEQQPRQVAARDAVTPHFISCPVRATDNEAIRQKMFALRYEVYCLERKFLPADRYPAGLEYDEHDYCSTHFVALNRARELAGTARLVQPRGDQPFPFETHCGALLENVRLPPKNQCGEVSRVIVHSNYRRRRGDSSEGVARDFLSAATPVGLSGAGPGQHERRSNRPEILLGLHRQMYHYSLDAGVRYWYAAMEKPLARTLRILGFAFRPIGQEVDYYGPVIPYIADLREIERNLAAGDPDLMAWFNARE